MLKQLQKAYEVALQNVVFVDFKSKSILKVRNIEKVEGGNYDSSN
ncbi:hypothetical protein [Lysinibacillus piscis]|uniref:Uncharacterized protein n=1 Tax=Lysinibacillus piscis TaxID=2518931 RepID=A0ABQ5NKX0_9BACI|nr:hypothetical protein [Lysinibacillus sp. KH24]GLC88669.1 hypothetical protein LYSBPC_17960 [Lysinibacillus sp. KH24]